MNGGLSPSHHVELHQHHRKHVELFSSSHDGTEHDANNVNVEFRTAPSNGNMTRKEYKNLGKAMSLCIAYSANIGGTASLTGTGPNLIMKGQADM